MLTTAGLRRSAAATNAEFIPSALPMAAAAANDPPIAVPVADFRIEWRRGAAAVAVSWPVSAAPECARWLLQCMGRSDPSRRPVAGHPAHRHESRC
jgi:hypothetical protein